MAQQGRGEGEEEEWMDCLREDGVGCRGHKNSSEKLEFSVFLSFPLPMSHLAKASIKIDFVWSGFGPYVIIAQKLTITDCRYQSYFPIFEYNRPPQKNCDGSMVVSVLGSRIRPSSQGRRRPQIEISKQLPYYHTLAVQSGPLRYSDPIEDPPLKWSMLSGKGDKNLDISVL